MKKLLLSAIITVFALQTATSQMTSLVKDVEPGTGSGMSYTYFTVMGTNAFFVGYTTANSYELWKTDATTGGTTMVKDVNPAAGNGNPSLMTVVGSTMYFLADNGSAGKELWKTDGTTAGTTLVKDIWTGTTSGVYNYTFIGRIGTTIFFEADAGTTGYELWKSDGTAGGTVLVKDIYSGANSSFSSTAYTATMGSYFYFTADNGINGNELWKTDGTALGTVMVKDINTSGASGSYPQDLTVIGTTLYFSADNGTNGRELWKSDGTAAGTVLVKDIYGGATSSNLTNFYVFGTTLLFRAGESTDGTELWKSDGTTAGTVMVKDIYAGTGDGYPQQFTLFGGLVYFTAVTSANGEELWKTDGTNAGTTLVKDIETGASGSSVSYMTVVGATMYFSAYTTATGSELWKTNGTTAGTLIVRDITLGASSSSPSALANMNGTLYFRAYLDVAGATFGDELFKSDGTSGGTVMVDDIYAGTSSGYPENFLYINSTVIFTATNAAAGNELFKVGSGYYKQAGFMATSTAVTSSSPFNHTDFIDQTPNDPISWAWTFTGGSPATSTVQNPTNIVYNTPGCYQVSLTTGFASGSDNETKTCYIVVTDINSVYCTAYGSANAGSYYVDGVNVGTINNTGTGSLGGPQYSSYLGQSTSMAAGLTYSIVITGLGGNDASYAAWIDYNRNGIFDASEFLGQISGWADPSPTRTITFTVPFGIYVGTSRLRIRVADDIFISTHIQLDPCGDGSWQDGETEDYSVVLSGGNVPVVDFSASQTSFNVGLSTDFTDLSTSSPSSWSWSFPGGTPSTSTLQNPLGIVYNTPGIYNVTLTATNGVGPGTLTKTGYIHVLNPGLAPVADFSATPTTIGLGHSTTFTDLSTNSPTSWSWSFPGGTPSTSTLANPTISYSAAGTYNVTLTASNANGPGTITKTGYIIVQDYCIPVPFSGTSGGWYISRVEAISLINGLELDNNTTAGAAYHYYPSPVVNLTVGETYALSAEGHSGLAGSPDTWGAFFIDWNQDGDFGDPGERVYEQLLSGSDLVPFGWNSMGIVVPATALPGYTRMRARIMRPSGGTSDPCAGYNDGETEDYVIFVTASAAAPVANFYAVSTSLAVGGTTNFFDQSTNVPTSWSWSFPGGSPATSTVQNPTNITYNAAGCYNVVLTATNASGSNTMTKTCYINVGGGGGTYCDVSISTYGTSQNDYIDGVSLGSINNTSTGSVGGPTYNDYTSMTTNITQSSSYSVAITSGTWPATYPDTYAAFIDWNHDGDFADANESLGEFISSATSTTQNIAFTVPAGATVGSTRMRIRGVYQTVAGSVDPCLSYDWGETEDYSVNIVSSVSGSAPVANFVASSTSIAPGGTVNFTDLSTNTPTSWSWSFSGGSPSTSTLQNPGGITFAASGCYDITLTATNASGSNTMVKGCYINVGTGGGGTCDTLSNWQVGSTIALYTVVSGGYMAGQNSYGDLAKCDVFTTYTAGELIDGVFLGFATADYASGASSINVKVWDNDGAAGAPNTVLATKTITIASIAPDVAAGIDTYVQFTSPVSVSGPYYIGIEFTYATGDTVALYTNHDGQTVPGTAWEKQSDLTWHPYSSSWGVNLAHYIFPAMCSTSTVNVSSMASADGFDVYPNPANDKVIIGISADELDIQGNGIQLNLYNSIGELVRSKKITSEQTEIDVNSLPNGIYLFQVSSDKGIKTKRIIKQ